MRLILTALPEDVVHVAEGGAKPIGRRAEGARAHLLFQEADGGAAGDLTGALATDAVGDDEQEAAGEQPDGKHGVLVVATTAAAMREGSYRLHG
jgi:hypothetical protein